MKIYRYLLLLLSFCSLVFMSCDPGYTIDYEVRNRTSGQLTIEHSRSDENGVNVNITSPETAIRIDQLFELGTTSRREIIDDNILPLDTLLIRNEAGDTINFNALDLNNWDVTFDTRTDLGVATLLVFNRSFE